MAQGGSNSILQRKTRSGREDFDARAMTPAKALRLALAKSADTLFDLALSVTTVEQRDITAGAVARDLGDDGLLVLLDGVGADGASATRGAVKLDTSLIAGLIEAQIGGAVRAGEARARRFTRTDAAMAAPFLEAVLTGFDREMASEHDGHRPYAMRFGDQMEDARVLGLALEGTEYELFRVTLDLANGAKTGVITVLLPRRAPRPAAGAGPIRADASMGSTLGRNALDATATLDAVLARITMPLRDICALAPGRVLTLPSDAIARVELYAPKDHLVSAVHLGQMNGQRAVRLTLSQEDAPVPPAPPGAGPDTPPPRAAAAQEPPEMTSDQRGLVTPG